MFLLHTVCAWIGNTKAVAAGHSLHVTDADWTRATGTAGGCGESGAKSGAAPDRSRSRAFAGFI